MKKVTFGRMSMRHVSVEPDANLLVFLWPQLARLSQTQLVFSSERGQDDRSQISEWLRNLDHLRNDSEVEDALQVVLISVETQAAAQDGVEEGSKVAVSVARAIIARKNYTHVRAVFEIHRTRHSIRTT